MSVAAATTTGSFRRVLTRRLEQASFPLAPVDGSCGNRVALPGAFRLTGDAPALVCFAPAPIDRAQLAADARAVGRVAVCARLDRE